MVTRNTNSSSSREKDPAVMSKPKKQVRWGTITALEFCVGHSACSVPESAGPPVGLKGSPIRYTVSSLSESSARHDTPESESESESESEAGSSKLFAHDGASIAASAATKYTTSSYKRSRQAFWLCPMERVQILADEDGHSLAEITAICGDVSALLDARAYSKFDHVALHLLESLEMSRHDDLRKLRQMYHQDNRKKIVLF